MVELDNYSIEVVDSTSFSSRMFPNGLGEELIARSDELLTEIGEASLDQINDLSRTLDSIHFPVAYSENFKVTAAEIWSIADRICNEWSARNPRWRLIFTLGIQSNDVENTMNAHIQYQIVLKH